MKINPIVLEALKNNKPVVALESTIISHGMPYPKNVETALTDNTNITSIQRYTNTPNSSTLENAEVVISTF